MSTRAAIYTRISKDTQKEGLGVQRQERECRDLAERRGWDVAVVFTDNDVSATRSKRRPGWDALLAAATNGEIDALLTYRTDRTWRKMRQLEDIIDLVEKRHLDIATVASGDIDLSTAEGRAFARQGAVWNQLETDKLSERVQAQKMESAANGWYQGGRRPYGYTPAEAACTCEKSHGTHPSLAIVPHEAEVIRELADRVLAGESPRALATEFNARGVPTAGGKEWRGDTIRRTLTAGTVAGLRTHNGESVAIANWPAILDRATWERVRSVLASRARVDTGRPSTHLLTGILKCSKCGGTLYFQKGRYNCVRQPENGHCGGTSITARHLEAFVAEVAITLASTTEKVEVPDPEPVSDEIEELEQRMERLSVLHHVEGRMSEREYLVARDGLEKKIRELRSELSGAAPTKWVAIEPGMAKELWEEATLDERREAIRYMVDEIVVLPGQRGRKGLEVGRLRFAWTEPFAHVSHRFQGREPSITTVP